MNSLPGELIEQICGLLKEDAPETLRAVILINRKWYQVAAPLFYATFYTTLEVRFIGLVGLQAIVAECTESGLGRPYLTHARKLVIITVDKGMDYWDLPAGKYWEPLLSLVTRLQSERVALGGGRNISPVSS